MSEQPTTRAIYVSLSEAAKCLSVSVKTVRRLIADGVIAGYRVGPKSLRVKVDDLENVGKRIPSANWHRLR
ncbi:putative DNA binding domain, excisionase family [Nostocoides australiense Ben110]|uniref:Putative DNA binding domain, excisionase family n=1 Tax=Nostocoides australiense Ben110 TaxID=1193182 RepID=W6K4E9_9MICO|nr:helix-turn-helix domain-containing protein [Tetrasphaera australiensis]CCH74894.1 putative DNA binding domain, excisionase family [Tetrasphaera australiensis Ben110]